MLIDVYIKDDGYRNITDGSFDWQSMSVKLEVCPPYARKE